MKKRTLLLILLFFVLNNNITFGNLEIGTGGIVKKEKIFNELECIKYDKNATGVIGDNKKLLEIMHYNFIQKDKKERLESEKYEKFNQCILDYKFNQEKQKYEKFSVYNKYKKSTSNIYDKIFQETIMFDDHTNECTFSAKKGEKSIFILHGKEIGKYKTIYSMVTKNTDDGKPKTTFSAELENGKIAIIENGKELFYSKKGEYKEGSLKYTNLGQIAFVEKDPFFGKEHLFINGKQKKEYSGRSVYYSGKSKKIDLLISEQNPNEYFLEGARYYINGKKIKYNFYNISGLDYLSNGKIIYFGERLDKDNLSYIVIDGKLGKGYNDFINVSTKRDKTGLYGNMYKFFETKNGDIYSIAVNENKKYILIKNGIELFEYKNEPEIYSYNTDHFVYTVELENGKYSIVVDGKKSLVDFDKKPELDNQGFFKLSQNGLFILDFKYNNFNYICNSSDYKTSTLFKNFKTKVYISKKLEKYLNTKYDKLIGKYTVKEILDKQKKDLINIKIKLEKIKKLKPKYGKIVKILEELIDSYLLNIEKQYKASIKNKSINKKHTLKKSEIESGLFNESTLKLKNNYDYNKLLTDKYLFNYIYSTFNYTSDENINYFKKIINKYIQSKGYKLSKNYKIGVGNKGGKYSGTKIFIINSKYIENFPKDKRLEVSFGI